jgi:hypothetical protein
MPPFVSEPAPETDPTQLRIMFLQGTAALWQASWNILGAGLRLAQDVGAHRRKVYRERPTMHDELWRRAFWYRTDRHA